MKHGRTKRMDAVLCLNCWMLESLALASCSAELCLSTLAPVLQNFEKQCLGELPSMCQRRNLLAALVIGGSISLLVTPMLHLTLTCQQVCVPALCVSYEAVDTYVPVSTGVTVAHAFRKRKSHVFRRVPADMFLRIPTYN